jgi:hypothetical protein
VRGRIHNSRPSAAPDSCPLAQWSVWFDRFLPRVTRREPRALFEPVTVSDRSDGKIAHLDGLNLSAPGAGGFWHRRGPRTIGDARSLWKPPSVTSRRAYRMLPATMWASTGWRRTRCSH